MLLGSRLFLSWLLQNQRRTGIVDMSAGDSARRCVVSIRAARCFGEERAARKVPRLTPWAAPLQAPARPCFTTMAAAAAATCCGPILPPLFIFRAHLDGRGEAVFALLRFKC